MKRWGGAVSFGLVLGLSAPVFGEVPQAAHQAIVESQGQLRVVTPYLDGTFATKRSSAFLVAPNRIIASLHALPREVDVALQGKRITFEGIPARLLFSAPVADMAVLKLDRAPPEKKPAKLAEKVILPSNVFAELYGPFNFNDKHDLYFDGLPFEGRIVGLMPLTPRGQMVPTGVEYFYTNSAVKPGFSGAMVVNERGEVVGMVSAWDGGYSAILSVDTIRAVLASGEEAEQKDLSSLGITKEEAYGIEEQADIIKKEVSLLYANQALSRPANLVSCVREMIAMRPSGECRDRFSYYQDPEEVKMTDEDYEGSFGGVGMELTMRDGKVVVVTPMPGTPAERAGIKPGDILEAVLVEGKEVLVKNSTHAVRLIRGKVGTTVEIVIRREKITAPLKFSLTREEIAVHSVKLSFIFDSASAAVIKVDRFTETTPEEFRDALHKARSQGVNKVVLDFRNNPGGLLPSVLKMLTLFMGVDDLAIVYRTRSEAVEFNQVFIAEELFDNGSDDTDAEEIRFGEFIDMEVVILINGGSASASEIFAGVMKDWGYTVIGERSFGKGVGQTGFGLSDGSRFFLTTFEFLVGNSKTPIRDKGVTPAIEIKNPDDTKQDLQLEKAFEILRSR